MNKFHKGLIWLGVGLFEVLMLIFVVVPWFTNRNLVFTALANLIMILILVAPFMIGFILMVLSVPFYAKKYGWSIKSLKNYSLVFAIVLSIYILVDIIKLADFLGILSLMFVTTIFWISYFRLRNIADFN
ncbi:hypothetical protein JXA48_02450 [Candidatus Woesearchaeota archaeon]|nr:hypothetical protein [Candidatus Woesearchaeota archaeon]